MRAVASHARPRSPAPESEESLSSRRRCERKATPPQPGTDPAPRQTLSCCVPRIGQGCGEYGGGFRGAGISFRALGSTPRRLCIVNGLRTAPSPHPIGARSDPSATWNLGDTDAANTYCRRRNWPSSPPTQLHCRRRTRCRWRRRRFRSNGVSSASRRRAARTKPRPAPRASQSVSVARRTRRRTPRPGRPGTDRVRQAPACRSPLGERISIVRASMAPIRRPPAIASAAIPSATLTRSQLRSAECAALRRRAMSSGQRSAWDRHYACSEED